jgi:hypothetical protein
MKNMQNPAAAMPVIHVHLPGGNDQKSPPSVPSDQPSSSSTLPNAAKLLKCPKMGPDLNVEQFCDLYDLSTDILRRLKENGYQKTKTFKHITIAQLQEMSFKHGEIASLQDAVDEWANSD